MALLGLLVGLFLGFLLDAILAMALGTALLIPGLATLVGPIAAGLTVLQAILLVVLLVVLLYLAAYLIATLALAPIPGPGVGALPAAPGELLSRGFCMGMTAALNIGIWSILGPTIIGFVGFLIIVLTAFTVFSRSPFHQAVLGWFSWLLPMSYIGTLVGGLLFVINAPFALVALGLGAFRVDWTTGVIETTGGIVGATGFSGGFSLGNFTFLAPGAAPFGPGLAAQSPFAGPTISAHEVGHTLNTAAMGGVVLWINAIDENVPAPGRGEAAYGELLAQSHAPGGASPSISILIANFVRIWS
jgi:hypothetical protein